MLDLICFLNPCLPILQFLLQPLVRFEDLVIYFSPQEWAELTDWQRELYQDVMEDTFELVASLGEPLGCLAAAKAPGPCGLAACLAARNAKKRLQ